MLQVPKCASYTIKAWLRRAATARPFGLYFLPEDNPGAPHAQPSGCRPPLILAPDLLHGRAGKRLLSPEEQVKLVRSLRMTLGGGGGGDPALSWWCVHQPMRNLRLVSPDRRRSLGARQRGPPASQANTTAAVNAQVHEPPVSHGPRADRPRCAARSREHGTDVLLHFSPGAC